MSNGSDYSNLSEARTNRMCIHCGYYEWRDANCRARLSCNYVHNGRAKGIRNTKMWRVNNPDNQRGSEVIIYLHCRPCHRENLGVLADLCLPSLLAHQVVQSGRSNLGDPAGRKKKVTLCTQTSKLFSCMCDKDKTVTAFLPQSSNVRMWSVNFLQILEKCLQQNTTKQHIWNGQALTGPPDLSF